MSELYEVTYKFTTPARSPAEAVYIAAQDMRRIARPQLYYVKNLRNKYNTTYIQNSPALTNELDLPDVGQWSNVLSPNDTQLTEDNIETKCFDMFVTPNGINPHTVKTSMTYASEKTGSNAVIETACEMQMNLYNNWGFIFEVQQNNPMANRTFEVNGANGYTELVSNKQQPAAFA